MKITDALVYEPDTGVFRWLHRHGGKANAGAIAGSLKTTGYIQILYKRKMYNAHRLAYLFITGSLPDAGFEVDHIDGVRSNNAWVNLRLCTKFENQQNRKLDRDSSSGLMGACLVRGRWYSQISFNRKKYILGYYDTKEDAHNAYLKKKAELHKFNPVPRNNA
uniref:HNH nuclease domain-containing protein n=3 Tax=unclassified bacterial viruses TaxID=12333 RepID=A0AAU6W2Q4_9VIRU